ncbi:hypothetical protein ABFS83_01G084900 [Erythranthe nasuta]
MAGGGRKNLKRGVEFEMATLELGQTVMQVVELRGSNLIEVMDSKGEKFIACFPAKFHKSVWIKRGNFVVVDESGREEAEESGRKVGGFVRQVLYHHQIRLLQKSLQWPEIFKSTSHENPKQALECCTCQKDDQDSSTNTNRVNPLELYVESEFDSDSDDCS